MVLNSVVVLQYADGNQADNVEGRNEENPPLIEQDSESPCLKGLVDQARYASLSCRHDMGVVDIWTGYFM